MTFGILQLKSNF